MELSMENQQVRAEQKLAMIMKHAPVGLAEIDRSGKIIHLNEKGEVLLKPILIATGIDGNDFFSVLEHIAPAIIEKIRGSSDEAGHILTNELYSFSLSFGGENIERNFSFTVIKMIADCTIISFDDFTDRYSKDKALQQANLDKAVLQGKFEIATNVLHDIGNAVVGFSSYVTRIKRSVEQDNSENLENLAGFFETQQSAISGIIGEAKAGALVKILHGITHTQKNNRTDINKSITEQQHIIAHIQEIIHIQRQYAKGNGINEKTPIHMDSVINDCMSMLYASLNKRDIAVSQDIPADLPVINGDRTRLMQVILNILKNSIEAIEVYAVDKSISIAVANCKGLLRVQIKDSGKGFDEATGQQLFERGFTTKASGSGIGLDSCRAIIESHGGTINISSDGFGKGALTTIEFKI